MMFAGRSARQERKCMGRKKTRENTVEKILGITFLAVGLLLLAIAVAIVAATLSGQKKTEIVRGVIVEMDETNTEVEYTYNGEVYRERISEYSSSMYSGKEIELVVNRDNPHKVRTKELLYLPTLVLCCVGLPFLLIGGFFIFLFYRKKRKKQRLMQTGRRLPAEVTGSRMNFNYTVNGRHPYQLECRYTDPATGAVYLFSSYNIWTDPELYVGQQVMVYVDPADYGKYYVDVDSLQSEYAVYDYR